MSSGLLEDFIEGHYNIISLFAVAAEDGIVVVIIVNHSGGPQFYSPVANSQFSFYHVYIQ